MRADLEALAGHVVLAIKTALAPVATQVQAHQEALKLRGVQDEAFTKELGLLSERLAILENRPLVPGPPGEPGTPGKDGEAGKPGLAYLGVYQDGKTYDVGHVVTWAGSTWHCNEETTSKPGDGSKAWTLMVKRGRDGKS